MPGDGPVIARVLFADRTARLVYEDPDGRQFVIGDVGERVYGVWFLPKNEADQPVIMDGKASRPGEIDSVTHTADSVRRDRYARKGFAPWACSTSC